MNSSSTTTSEACDQPVGAKKCGACKSTPYCGPIDQIAVWSYHKEECPGNLRKVVNIYGPDINTAAKGFQYRSC